MPDDELLDLAAKGRLKDPVILDQQVRRMLKDPKSRALIENFGGQWLYLRELASATPVTKDFDDNLRQAFRRETEMLLESIVREDRSILTILDADYTFVNERLARHYGIPGIRGDYFRRNRSWAKRSETRSSGAGKFSDRDFDCDAYLSSHAWKMDSAESSRCAASGASSWCRGES
jgi:hypothetical protein